MTHVLNGVNVKPKQTSIADLGNAAAEDIRLVIDELEQQESSFDMIDLMATAWRRGYIKGCGPNVLVVFFFDSELDAVYEMCERSGQAFITGYNLASYHLNGSGKVRAYLWPMWPNDDEDNFPTEYWGENASKEEIEIELRSRINKG